MAGENLTIYKASAGSGKTFRLAYEFIKHILARRDNETGHYILVTTHGVGANRHRAILAITFTNKATEEMKRRIVRELAMLAGAPLVKHCKSDYRTLLMKELGCTSEQLTECARTALTNLLFDFNFFNVSTIDAFFQTVLRVFAHEAELSGNYEVEIADRYAIESGVNELFNRVIRDADQPMAEAEATDTCRLIHWLNTYMMSQINNGKSFSIFNRNSQLRSSLISFFTSLTGEDFKYHEQELMAYINRPELLLKFEQELSERRSTLAAEIKQLAAEIVTTIDSTTGFTSRSLVAGLLPTLRQFAAGGLKLPESVNRANTDDDPSCRFAAKPLRDGLVTPQLDRLIRTTLLKAFDYTELNIIAKQIYNFGLFGRVMREISQYRRDNNLILLSDTNSLLREIIGENSTPFVYERVGLWLRHFLIDEFQDTSGLQWDNLRPLIANSIAESNDNLIIGDEKQCIYRFRNSDPTLLQSRVSREFDGRVRLEGNTSESNTNYRSSATVVEFNNMLFSALAVRFGLTSLYANVKQAAKKELPGYVNVHPITGGQKGNSFKSEAVQHMLCEIARELSSGYRQSDITILVRSNAEADFVISQVLERAAEMPELGELQFLSDDALTIGSNASVQQIVNRLHSLNRPAGASQSEKYTSPEQYTAIIREADRLNSEGMSRSEAVSLAISAFHAGTLPEGMHSGEQDNVFHSLYNLVEELIAELPEAAQHRDTVYLSAFQDEVLDFMSRGQADLYSFLRWWDSRKDKAALASAPGLNAIRIMTIHKSKGLEFPCVHIPLLSGSLRSDRDTIRWYSTENMQGFDREIIPPMIPLASSSALNVTSFASAYNKVLDDNLIDELNVLYVAFTRAVNELIVSYSAPTASKDAYSTGAVLKAVLGNDGNYTSGRPTTMNRPDEEHSDTAKDDEPGSTDMPDYTPGVRTGLTALAVCDELPDTDSPRFKGNMLHRVLADVHHRRELPVVVRRLAVRGIVPRAQVAAITESLMRATDDPRVRPWFEDYDYVANETTIHIPGSDDGDESETRRPDRIVVRNDGSIDVIDYKFGEVHTSAYHRQVAHYMDLLRRLHPDAEIRGYVWYIPSGHIDRVDG